MLTEMLTGIKAVIFDLDGTLMDSMWVWTDIDIEYLGRYGQTLPEDLQDDIAGMSFTETAEYFKKRFQLPESLEEIKKEWNRLAYEQYAKHVPLKSGAAAFLQELSAAKIPLGIASSNSRELIAACLRSNHVADFFDSITISCDVPKGKPAPDVYLLAARSLGVQPQDCLVFEDIPEGIQAGKNAGMKVCAVEDAFSAHVKQEIRRLADYYIRSYDEIADGTYEVLTEIP